MKKATKKKSEDYILTICTLSGYDQTPVKLQKNWHKTVGGVANTKCLESIYFGRKND